MTDLTSKLSESQNTNTVHRPAVPLGSTPLDVKFYKKPYNTYRRAKIIMFSSVLNERKEVLSLTASDRFALIEKIERSCFNYAISRAIDGNIPTKWENDFFKDLYGTICAKIGANITLSGSVQNTYLLPAILNGTVSITELPKMSSQELFPEKYKEVIEKLESSKNVQRTIKTSAMYRCRRCHKNECTIENRYNRSLDEGVNLTITCVACGNEWNA
jgi:DNA-directed RNA polymerase subunit M/transcription elongation factor TFIIS